MATFSLQMSSSKPVQVLDSRISLTVNSLCGFLLCVFRIDFLFHCLVAFCFRVVMISLFAAVVGVLVVRVSDVVGACGC